MNKQNNNNDTIRTEPEGFITKETLAIRLSRTVRTVENWQRRGIIPYVKCGRCVLFKWTDVETHLQTHFRVCGHQNGVGHRNGNERRRSSIPVPNLNRNLNPNPCSSVVKNTHENPKL